MRYLINDLQWVFSATPQANSELTSCILGGIPDMVQDRLSPLFPCSRTVTFYANRNVLEGLIREITKAGKNKNIRHTIRTTALIIRINPKLNSIGT